MQGIPENTPASSLRWDQDQVGTKNESANSAGTSSQECVGTLGIPTNVKTDNGGSELKGLTLTTSPVLMSTLTNTSSPKMGCWNWV
jgi:hypothetical protein